MELLKNMRIVFYYVEKLLQSAKVVERLESQYIF